MDDETKQTLLLVGLLVLCLLIILNTFFWLNDTCWEAKEKICLEFVSHGLSWWHCLIISLALIEIAFIILCYWKKKKTREDIWGYVGLKKLQSLIIIPLFYLVIFPVSWLIYNYGINILISFAHFLIEVGIAFIFVLGIVIVGALYYLMNVGIAKLINRNNKKRRKK